jgi:hypothetical protein
MTWGGRESQRSKEDDRGKESGVEDARSDERASGRSAGRLVGRTEQLARSVVGNGSPEEVDGPNGVGLPDEAAVHRFDPSRGNQPTNLRGRNAGHSRDFLRAEDVDDR